ncbi:MAG: hypothetical protein ABJB66_16960 [Gemmatimonadaceae bacterium]
MRMVRSILPLVFSTLALAPLGAQLPNNLIYQVSLGVNNTSEAQFPDQEFESIELLFGKEFFSHSIVSPLLIANGGSTGHLLPGGDNLICHVTPGYSGCGPEMPSLAYLGVLAGAHAHYSIFSFGLMIGPQMIFASSQAARLSSSTTPRMFAPINRFGVQSRLDVAIKALPHTEIVFSARELFVPNFYEGRAKLRGGSLGVRFR